MEKEAEAYRMSIIRKESLRPLEAMIRPQVGGSVFGGTVHHNRWEKPT